MISRNYNDIRGFRISNEPLLDWITIERPTVEYKSEGYRARKIQKENREYLAIKQKQATGK